MLSSEKQVCKQCELENKSAQHKQVFIELGKRSAEVDEQIAPLIMACWGHDINTEYSCQESVYFDNDVSGETILVGYIQFMGEEETNKFLTLAVKKFSKFIPLTNEISPFPLYTWRYEMYPCFDESLFLMTTVNIPIEDLEIVTKVLNDSASEADVKEHYSFLFEG